MDTHLMADPMLNNLPLVGRPIGRISDRRQTRSPLERTNCPTRL